LFFQLDASTSVLPLTLSSAQTSTALSSSKIYRLTLDETTNSSDCIVARRGKCRSTVDLQMFFAEECSMGVICTKLEGEPCADYQVKIEEQRVRD
jgi:hypothetical protein